MRKLQTTTPPKPHNSSLRQSQTVADVLPALQNFRFVRYIRSTIHLYLLILFIALVLLVCIYKYTVIENIIITSPKSDKLSGLNILYGKSLITTSHNQLKQIILESNPRLEDALLDYKLPKSIYIVPVYEVPQLYIKSADKYYALNSNTKVIAVADSAPSAWPRQGLVTYQLLTPSDIKVGQVVKSTDIQFIQKYVSRIRAAGISDYSVDIKDSKYMQLQVSGARFILGRDTNPSSYMQFEDIISHLLRAGFSPMTYDLRFEKSYVSN